jgi:hypothetical protein
MAGSRSDLANKTEGEDFLLLCSNCFADEGLRINAFKLGLEKEGDCPNCQSASGRKLTKSDIQKLAWRFFVSGTTIRCKYGAAPVIQFNEQHYGESTISPSTWLNKDVQLIENAAKIGFFHYGPRLWMVGEVEPLKDLQDPTKRSHVIGRVIKEYPRRTLVTVRSGPHGRSSLLYP